jgi:hypothetical protein
MAGSTNVPGAPVIKFDSGAWQMLERFVDEVKTDLDSTFLKATSGLKLDASLKTELHPGSESWPVVAALTDAAKGFGDSVQTQFTTLSDDWDTFVRALMDGERIFEDHDDLATMSAQDLLSEDPDLAAGSPPV